MMRTIVIASTVLLCGFGAGPFWGENVQTSVAPPGLEISAFGKCSDTTNGIPNATCSYDAGTADGLIVSICGTLGSPNPMITPTTPMTYNGVPMTQLVLMPEQVVGSGYITGAIYYLNSPSPGTNDIFIDWDGAATSNVWAISAAQLTGQAVVQTGPTDQVVNASSATITNTISGHDVADIVYHFGCLRGGNRPAMTSNLLTDQDNDVTGPTGVSDVIWTLATGNDASPTTNTLTTTGNPARNVGGMLAILPQ